jgi:hypothetical protein
MTTSALHHIPRRTKRLPPLRVGIGGPVGSGKTTLLEMLCKAMRQKYDLVAITNDIYTKEDQRLLTVSGALPAERILGVETGGCPHTAIREDASINLEAIDRMLEEFPDADVVFIAGAGGLSARRHPDRPGHPGLRRGRGDRLATGRDRRDAADVRRRLHFSLDDLLAVRKHRDARRGGADGGHGAGHGAGQLGLGLGRRAGVRPVPVGGQHGGAAARRWSPRACWIR